MRTSHLFSIAASVVLALLMSTYSFAHEPANTPTSQDTTSAVANDTQQAAASAGEKWRYRQHQGLWWYWLPSEKWVYWFDGKWVPYDPQVYAQLRTTRRRAYSSSNSESGYPELGQWGRVRYNGYGQREYPYSRRSSGIRQLGPVPAMGGVRSLPGWGGER